jgi:uncharacterized protein GlcG (DUF336 family)
MNIDLDLSLELISAAKKKAKEIDVPMVIAVVDAGGNLIAQQRMDDALLVSIDISLNKAYTAVAVRMPTHELAEVSQSGQPLFGIHNADKGRIVIFGGGFPLKENDKIIGGIGVSGGSVEDDIICAKAALERLKALKGMDR